MDINKIKLSRNKAKSICQAKTWDPTQAPNLTDEALIKLREGLCGCLKPIFEDENNYISKKDYTIDCLCGLAIKAFLEQEDNNWFSLRLAANDDFWAFLSIEIIPDIVYKRYEKSIDHYCWDKHRNRIWLKAIWWYVFLSWQGNTEQTKNTLLCPSLNTDTIVALVERPGKGMRVDFCRALMKSVAQLTNEMSEKFKKDHTIIQEGGKDKSTTIFRALMKANTAMSAYMEPDLCDGGVHGYVRMLFDSLRVSIDIDQPTAKETDSSDLCPLIAEDKSIKIEYSEDRKALLKVQGANGVFTIPNTISRIAANAFLNCSELKSIVIPNSITSIGDKAFSGCTGLKSITLPESVCQVGSHIFENCKNIKQLHCRMKSLAKGSVNIEESAFKDLEKYTLYVPFESKDLYLSSLLFSSYFAIIPER